MAASLSLPNLGIVDGRKARQVLNTPALRITARGGTYCAVAPSQPVLRNTSITHQDCLKYAHINTRSAILTLGEHLDLRLHDFPLLCSTTLPSELDLKTLCRLNSYSFGASMTVVGLKLVITAQELLRTAGIHSAVTGDVGLSYHGVDIVTHLLPSVPARFKILNADETFELHLVEDSMLGLRLTPNLLERGLCFATVHPQLQDLCEGTEAVELAAITWPSLAEFLRGWLRLAETNKHSEVSMIYLMQAERLIDANDKIDEEWLELNVKEPACCKQGKKLLKGKASRTMQSTWD
ncbi:uncharacterized protein MYCFIDRAFT_77417 [Pseudocercospora fijiensis CIRAD86]|uniref:Uncharacterized protein n=1 Tax=Pseudocercospora fijiensis (strain CIRAD86) TaxID=383855 RepID=M3AQ94_PSEFD|nr:uncharacterized protein MYCFIDRAFT_77417 [Pseudocercospora fijiensis CIRAD86]EME86761.1 hypothetical protein MYCFIDRAFT_77417 [Pseudocercospora fijiensis CIRAD86]